MMANNRMECLIWDLGNVVFSCSFDHAFGFWGKKTAMGFEEAKARFVFDETHRDFECGKVAIAAFYNHVNRFYDGRLSFNDFCAGWNSIYEEVYPGIEELLRKYKNRFTQIALTNTNALHAREWKPKYRDTLAIFDAVYSSHEIGMRKPDREIYDYLLHKLKLSAGECLFLDDNPQNVEAARLLGIKTILVSDGLNTAGKQTAIDSFLA